MNRPFKTLWAWLRHRTGLALGTRKAPVRIVSTRRLPGPQPVTLPVLPPPRLARPAEVIVRPGDLTPMGAPTAPSVVPAEEDLALVPSQSRHIARRQMVIRPLRPDEPLETNSETWERLGNSFVTTETRTRILTAGNMLASPQQVAGFCARCGRPDREFLVCGRTGARLCRSCVSFFPAFGAPIPVSKEAAPALRRKLTTWDMHDLKKGLKDETALRRLFPFHAPPPANDADDTHA